jgi:hypothetical protein
MAILLLTDYRRDEDPLEVEIGLGAKDFARCRISGEQFAVDHSTRFARAGCAPSPRPVGTFAGQLDVDPSPHAERPR